MEVLPETLRHPSGIQGPHALDGCIQNYDCPYHIILTNVKTKPQIASPEKAGGPVAGLWDGVSRGSLEGGAHAGAEAPRSLIIPAGPRHPRLAGYEDYPA
jgi:hypothetical protein